ncbi:hypothetical protein shim_18530 [Shimia sp. SK013]|uniref:DUF4177 domain-containing protein n=1 Tax=Shimia sp. SK013 TaxID=1389006 RepID=UPI0006B65C5D|nr:DUF4177 domain-containing protein [Shimia sp. SK013]KPA21967.1 hypothetical protein shim_18530 [Shimia sp. SK013]
MIYEYKVVPAPTKGQKARGVRSTEGRFANALQASMNTLAADGWEFLRTETLPSEERSGLASTATKYRSVMVFRRPRADDASAFQPKELEHPKAAELPAPAASTVAAASTTEPPLMEPSQTPGTEVSPDRAVESLNANEVSETSADVTDIAEALKKRSEPADPT